MSVERQLPSETDDGPAETAWYRRFGAIVFVIFCFEIGVFLLIFPWLDPWANNWIADAMPSLGRIWDNPYFRGAVSGVGFLNIYISLVEVFRLRRAG